MSRRGWLLVLGAGLLGAGLFVSPSVFVRVLDSDVVGEELKKLRLGVWLFKALLCGHGVWLLLGGLRRQPGLDEGDGKAGSRLQGQFWQPVALDDGPQEAWTTHGFLLVLLGFAAGLRWTGIHQDLWYDEILTLVEFVRPHLGQILSNYSSDNQHLLYSVLAHLSVVFFGESAASLRLPAVLLGVASLWATFRLGRLIVGRRQAMLAVALLTVSYHHVWFSQNARGYTGLLLMTVVSTELFLRSLWSNRWSGWTAYAGALAIGMAFHPTMIFVAAAHGIVLLGLVFQSSARTSDRWRPFGAMILAGTLTLQAYALVLPQMLGLYLQPAAGADPTEFEWKSPIWMINETIRGLGVGLGFGWIGLGAAGLLVAFGLHSLISRSRLTAICFILPALLGGATMVLLGRNLWPRFFFNSGAFAVLVVVQGAWVLGNLLARRRYPSGERLGLVMASLLVFGSMATLPKAYRHPKQDFTAARLFVEEHRSPGDSVVALDLAADAYLRYYAPELATAHSLDELESQKSTAGSTWILYTLAEHLRATKPLLWQAVQTDYEVVQVFPGTLSGGDLFIGRSLEGIGLSVGSAPGRGSGGDVANELSDTPD